MQKFSLLIGAAALIAAASTSCSKKSVDESRLKKVVVYTYDSFIDEWGAGPALKELFERENDYTIEYVDCGDGVQIATRAMLEKNAPEADVLLGIDNNLAANIISSGVLQAYKPKDADRVIDPALRAALGKDWSLTPYDWSHFALIYDTESSTPAPKSLADLTDSKYEKKIILMDPRTSTPGLGFVAWTVAVFGDGYLDFWKALKPNLLTVAPGWSSGYGLFTKGEAPLVISYTTSPAYHVEYEDTNRYQALIFDEGHVMQVEGAGVVRNAPNEKGAKAFMDFLISHQAQAQLPLTQWMYPANSTVPLPKSYAEAAPIANHTLQISSAETDAAVEKITALLTN